MPYFPTPRPSELIYSMVARYKAHLKIPTPRLVNEVLFGNPKHRPQYDLPVRLKTLAERLPRDLDLDAERLIDDHTLFAYYGSFKSEEQTRAARQAVLGAGAHLASGLSALGFRALRLKRLRFCPLCRDEMLDAFGEQYWRREHQIDVVVICPFHDCDLRLSNVTAGCRAYEYHAASDVSCPYDAPPCLPATDDAQRADIRALALEAVDRLKPEQRPHYLQWRDRLHEIYAQKGLTFGDGRINREVLEDALVQRFNHLRSIWPFLFEFGKIRSWIEAATWQRHAISKGSPFAPYLLLKATEALPDRPEPFGNGPWPCLNPLSPHVGELRIAAYSSRDMHSGRYLGTFECGCGYTYVRSTKLDGTLTDPKLKRYGASLDAHVREAVKEGWDVSKTAKLAMTNTTRIRATARRLGLKEIWPKRVGRT